jgi:hypothetical protein
MTTYICDKCSRVFKQKSHLDDHLARKRDCTATMASASADSSPKPSVDPDFLAEELIMQRERLTMEYAHATTREARAGRRLTYENQQEAATAIVEHFRAGKSVVVLVAQPGAGKTGGALEVMYRMAIGRPDDTPKESILTGEMGVLSGMSDCDWREQFASKMLPSLNKHVYHRGNLPRNRKHLAAMRLVVDDECHIAAEKDMVVSKEFREAGLLDIEAIEAAGRKLLQISATPEAVAHDLQRWGHRAALVVLKPGPDYKGFETMLAEGRIRKAPDLTSYEAVLDLLRFFNDRFASTTKKYFPFRIRGEKVLSWVERASTELGWGAPVRHDSTSRIEDIDEQMKHAPAKHTVILVKGFWRASKRLVRDHVGGSYETIPSSKRNTTATAQGLTARFCDTYTYSGDYLNPEHRPVNFCDVEAIQEYLEWFKAGCDFKKAAYTSTRIMSNGAGDVRAQKTKVHPSNVTGLDATEEPPAPSKKTDPRKEPPTLVSVTPEMLREIQSAPDRYTTLMKVLIKAAPKLVGRLAGYNCIQISCPRVAGSIKRHIDDVVAAAVDKRPFKIDIKREHVEQNCYNCYIDAKDNRLCFVIWNGTAAASSSDSSDTASTIEHVTD